VAWYPDGEEGAVVVKDPIPTGDTALSRVLRDWERFRGGVFLFHIRGAAKRARQENTHPFCRSYGGHDWLFAHNGQLDADRLRALSDGPEAVFEPTGRTDSERALCWLLNTIRAAGIRRLRDIGWPQLHAWMRELDALGTLNAIITDGHDLAAYRDDAGFNSLHFTRIAPPHKTTNLRNNVVEIDFGDPLDINCWRAVFCRVLHCDPRGRMGRCYCSICVARLFRNPAGLEKTPPISATAFGNGWRWFDRLDHGFYIQWPH
jgi:predicted glutamine amidotransferase